MNNTNTPPGVIKLDDAITALGLNNATSEIEKVLDRIARESNNEIDRARYIDRVRSKVPSLSINVLKKSLKIKLEDIEAARRKEKQKEKQKNLQDLGRQKTFPEQWLDRWIKDNQYLYYPPTDSVMQGGCVLGKEEILANLRLDAHADQVDLAIVAFEKWKSEKQKENLSNLNDKLAYQACAEDLVGHWVEAVTGARDVVDVAVMAHFIWQIKRKLFYFVKGGDLKVEKHLMPICYGLTNGGKSTAIDKLISPLKLHGVVEPVRNMQLIEDDRHTKRFATALVCFADEMGKVKKTDVDTMKNFLTAELATWRLLGEHGKETAFNMSTWIGASNRKVIDIINDDTGMRRFYQITCKDRIEWPVINKLDYLKMWKSVDPTKQTPIMDHWDEVQQRQREITVGHSIAEWLETCCKLVETSDESSIPAYKWVSGQDAYRSYALRMQLQRRTPETEIAFGRFLKDRLGHAGWKRSNGIRYRIEILDGSTVHSVDEQPQTEPSEQMELPNSLDGSGTYPSELSTMELLALEELEDGRVS